MAMNVGSPEGGEDQVMSAINTTPLVDVMLVLLIIFLITIPVVTKTVEMKLPDATNEALITKPENVVIEIDKKGEIYWNTIHISSEAVLERARNVALQVPQPEIHIRADREARFEHIGRVTAMCQRAGILKVGFVTDPEVRGGTR